MSIKLPSGLKVLVPTLFFYVLDNKRSCIPVNLLPEDDIKFLCDDMARRLIERKNQKTGKTEGKK